MARGQKWGSKFEARTNVDPQRLFHISLYQTLVQGLEGRIREPSGPFVAHRPQSVLHCDLKVFIKSTNTEFVQTISECKQFLRAVCSHTLFFRHSDTMTLQQSAARCTTAWGKGGGLGLESLSLSHPRPESYPSLSLNPVSVFSLLCPRLTNMDL